MRAFLSYKVAVLIEALNRDAAAATALVVSVSLAALPLLENLEAYGE